MSSISKLSGSDWTNRLHPLSTASTFNVDRGRLSDAGSAPPRRHRTDGHDTRAHNVVPDTTGAPAADSAELNSVDGETRAYMLIFAQMVEQSGGDGAAVMAQYESAQSFSSALSSSGDGHAESFAVSMSSMEEMKVAASFGADGATIAASYRAAARVEFRQEIETDRGERFIVEGFVEIEVEAAVFAQAQTADPLAFDLDGDGAISLTELTDGVDFDLNADGALDRSMFTTGSDMFLAFDRNGNGAIDDGSELFGDQHGARNGFDELRKFDETADGRIDQNDSIFSQLLGFSVQGAEQVTKSLTQLGIESISLTYSNSADPTARAAQLGSYQRTDGSKGFAADLLLDYAPATSLRA